MVFLEQMWLKSVAQMGTGVPTKVRVRFFNAVEGGRLRCIVAIRCVLSLRKNLTSAIGVLKNLLATDPRSKKNELFLVSPFSPSGVDGCGRSVWHINCLYPSWHGVA